MKNETTINKGILWATGEQDTSLYVRPIIGGYLWTMFSPKTGTHAVKQKGGIEPIVCERVRSHWDGFQFMQTK